jgi:NhaA family Na+:H+ antiporter
VSFAIIPLFALANAGVPFEVSDLGEGVAIATMAGLFIGKPVGIFLASFIAVKLGVARLPEGVSWSAVVGGGFLAGIGFTMALFIAGLALSGDALDVSKVGILTGSLASGIVGMAILVVVLPKSKDVPD